MTADDLLAPWAFITLLISTVTVVGLALDGPGFRAGVAAMLGSWTVGLACLAGLILGNVVLLYLRRSTT